MLEIKKTVKDQATERDQMLRDLQELLMSQLTDDGRRYARDSQGSMSYCAMKFMSRKATVWRGRLLAIACRLDTWLGGRSFLENDYQEIELHLRKDGRHNIVMSATRRLPDGERVLLRQSTIPAEKFENLKALDAVI